MKIETPFAGEYACFGEYLIQLCARQHISHVRLRAATGQGNAIITKIKKGYQ